MRLIASFVFHLLTFLRVPLILFLRLGSVLLFLGGLATLCYIPLGHKEAMLGKMLAFAFGGSFGFYLVGVGYDRILLAVNRARFAPQARFVHGVR